MGCRISIVFNTERYKSVVISCFVYYRREHQGEDFGKTAVHKCFI